ncbi:hypothetical protein [Mycobacteroides chelonae]
MTDAPAPADMLKYAAALLAARLEWITDEITGSGCDHGGHEPSIDALCDTGIQISELASLCGDPLRYSDGRQVKSTREIEQGVITSHVWYPDPGQEKPQSWRGALRHDPDEPSPGVYEVTLTPATQDIHVRVVRTA